MFFAVRLDPARQGPENPGLAVSLAMPAKPTRTPAQQKTPAKTALDRLLRLHDFYNLAFRGRLPMRGDERLQTNDRAMGEYFGVTPKTISRDREYMRSRYCLPLEWDALNRNWTYTRECPVFPIGPNLDDDEKLALMIARQALGQFVGVKLADHLGSAFEKITGAKISDMDGITLEALDAFLSIRTPGAGWIPDKDVFERVKVALLCQRELVVEYQGLDQSQTTQRRLQPLHLACVESRWVLVARDVSKQAIRTYVLARMSKPKVTKVEFARPVDFDGRAFLGSSIGVHTGHGGMHLIKLRISPRGAHHVLERRWHESQQNTNLPGGYVQVEFALSDYGDVTRFILSFGSDCEVLEPEDLRAQIAAEVQKMDTQLPAGAEPR